MHESVSPQEAALEAAENQFPLEGKEFHRTVQGFVT